MNGYLSVISEKKWQREYYKRAPEKADLLARRRVNSRRTFLRDLVLRRIVLHRVTDI